MLALSLVACGGGGAGDGGPTPPTLPAPTPPPVNPSEPQPEVLGNLVQGRLAGWPYTAAHLRVELLASDRWAPAEPGAIPASGEVRATLPDPDLSMSLLDGCMLPAGFQGASARYDIASLKVYSAQNDYLGDIFESSPKRDVLLRLYASAGGTLSGEALCDGDRMAFNLTLKSGWNLVKASIDPQGTLRVQDAGKVTPQLLFSRADEQVVIVPQSREPLTLRRGETAQVLVRIYQMGGVSGTVRLQSGRNGLEITPATLTLPGGVGMQAQSVQALRPAAHTLRSALPPELRIRLAEAGPGAEAMREQAVTQTLSVAAQDWAMEGGGELPVLVTRDGQPLGGGSLPSVTVLVPNLSLETVAAQIDQGTSGTLDLSVYPQGYRGEVSVEVRGLPAGVQAPAVNLNFSNGEKQTVRIPVTVSASQALGHFPVTVVATEQGTGLSSSRRELVTVMPVRVALAQGGSDMTVDQAGNLWTSGTRGMVRQRPDGTFDAFANPGYNCGAMTLGEDGGVWQMSAPQVRFDAVTGSARVMSDPRGWSGCAGSGMHFDAQGRGWDWYFGIHRLDYASNKAVVVPGSENDRLLDVQGEQVWISTTVDGGARLGRIHAGTLARELFTLPGINILNEAHAAAGKVWLPRSVPGRLAAFDPSTGAVQQFDVHLDGAAVQNFEVLGVDAQGRHWLEIARSDGALQLREWVLYSPETGLVVRRVPAIFASGSGQLKGISPGGTLWVRTMDNSTFEPYAYVYQP